MKTLHDWKGNKIKEGHEFLLVLVDQKQTFFGAGTELTFGHISKDGFTPKSNHTIPVIDDYWSTEGRYYYRNNTDGNTFLSQKYDFGILSIDMPEEYPPQGHIICIEGVSDSKEEYYQSKNSQSCSS